MSMKEIRERLANREQIRECQDIEERAEAERDRIKRIEAERQIVQRQKAAAAAAASSQQAAQSVSAASRSLSNTTTAAADTSSEVAKKCKERFLKETSRVIVKVLDPYRRPDARKGQIRNTEDFKHLAKKVRVSRFYSVFNVRLL